MSKHVDRPHYTSVCSKCGVEWAACEIRKCPRNGKPICRYCCQSCENVQNMGAICGCKLWNKN